MGVWAAMGLSIGLLVRTESILAWVTCSLRCRDAQLDIPGTVHHAGTPGETTAVQNLLRPVFRHVARDDHAERAALLSVLARATQLAAVQPLAEISGLVRLYVSHFPCISCIAVLGQLKRQLPAVVAEVAFDDAWEDGGPSLPRTA